MKRFVIVSIFVLAMLMVGAQVNASTIDLISQTYSIKGVSDPALNQSVNITSSVPPLVAPWNSSFYPDLHANGGASGPSAFFDIAANGCGDCYSSATLAFRVEGASYLDLSYSFLYPPGFGRSDVTLVDSTTGVTLAYAFVSNNPAIPASGLFVVPIVSTDTYSLVATASCPDYDIAAVKGTLSAIPEPSTMLLLGSGLVGLVGFRRKFKK